MVSTCHSEKYRYISSISTSIWILYKQRCKPNIDTFLYAFIYLELHHTAHS